MQIFLITSNLQGQLQRKKLNGREHYVVPVTLLREAVLNGSRGPLFYPADDISASESRWNGIPIVLGHPKDANGKEVSARTVDVLNASGLGVILDTQVNGALQAKAWLDVENVKRIAPELDMKLQRNEQVEVSTGLYLHVEPTSGVYNGRNYDGVAKQYTPDHLAVLLDGQVGACSVNDGCGINNEENNEDDGQYRMVESVGSVDFRSITTNQLSHMDLHSKLQEVLERRTGGGYLVDIFDNFVVYKQGDSLYKLGYTTDLRTEDGQVALSNDGPIAVKRVISYKSASMVGNEDDEMKLSKEKKAEIVTKLTTNCECWKGEGDDVILNGLPDEKLVQLEKALDTPAPTPAPPPEEKPANNEAPPPKQATAEEWLASAPEPIRSVVQNAMRVEQERKLLLIDQLTANMDDGDNKTRIRSNLSHKSVDELSDLASLMPKSATARMEDNGQWVAANASPSYRGPQRKKPTDSLPLPMTDWKELAASN